MTGARSRCCIALTALFCCQVPAFAEDPLGTAGRFRFFGWANCGKPIPEQMRGGCDPAPVDPADLSRAEIVDAHIQRAIRFVSFLRMNEATAAANEAVNADPKSVKALTFRARLAMSNLNGAAAERDLNAGLLLAPGDPNLLATRAGHLLELGKPQLALRDASAALKAGAPSADALWIRARIFMELNQLDEAETDLTRALELEPGVKRVHFFRALVRMRLARFEDAITDTSELLSGRGMDPSALEIRALCYGALGRTNEALDDLAVLLGPPGTVSPTGSPISTQLSRLRVLRAMVLVRAGREVEAEQDLAIVLDKGGKRALLRMQLHLRRNGFPDVPLDGQRTAKFDDALKACFLNRACGRGLTQPM